MLCPVRCELCAVWISIICIVPGCARKQTKNCFSSILLLPSRSVKQIGIHASGYWLIRFVLLRTLCVFHCWESTGARAYLHLLRPFDCVYGKPYWRYFSAFQPINYKLVDCIVDASLSATRKEREAKVQKNEMKKKRRREQMLHVRPIIYCSIPFFPCFFFLSQNNRSIASRNNGTVTDASSELLSSSFVYDDGIVWRLFLTLNVSLVKTQNRTSKLLLRACGGGICYAIGQWPIQSESSLKILILKLHSPLLGCGLDGLRRGQNSIEWTVNNKFVFGGIQRVRCVVSNDGVPMLVSSTNGICRQISHYRPLPILVWSLPYETNVNRLKFSSLSQ